MADNDKYDALLREYHGLENINSNLAMRLEMKENENKNLKEVIAELMSENNSKDVAISKASKVIEMLREDLEKAVNEVKNTESSKGKLIKENKDLEREIQELKKSFAQVNVLKKSEKRAKSQTKKLKEELESAAAERDNKESELMKKYNGLIETNKRLEKRIEELIAELKESKESFRVKEREYLGTLEKLRKLEADIESKEEELAKIIVERDKMEKIFKEEMNFVKREAENKIRNIQSLNSRDAVRSAKINDSPKRGTNPLMENNKQLMVSVFDHRSAGENLEYETTARGKVGKPTGKSLGKSTAQTNNRSLSSNKIKSVKEQRGESSFPKEEIKNVAKNLFDSDKKSDQSFERRNDKENQESKPLLIEFLKSSLIDSLEREQKLVDRINKLVFQEAKITKKLTEKSFEREAAIRSEVERWRMRNEELETRIYEYSIKMANLSTLLKDYEKAMTKLNKMKIEEKKIYDNYARELEANVNFFQIELQEKYKILKEVIPESERHLLDELNLTEQKISNFSQYFTYTKQDQEILKQDREQMGTTMQSLKRKNNELLVSLESLRKTFIEIEKILNIEDPSLSQNMDHNISTDYSKMFENVFQRITNLARMERRVNDFELENTKETQNLIERIRELESEVNYLNTEKEGFDSEKEHIETQIHSLQELLDGMSATVEDANTTIARLKAENDDLKSNFQNKIQKEIEGLNSIIMSKEQIANEYEQTNLILQQKLTRKKEKLVAHRKSLEQFQGENETIATENKFNLQKIQSLTKDYNQTVTLLEKALKDFEESQISLAKNEKLYSIVEELQKENNEIKDEYSTLITKMDEFNKNSDEVKESVLKLREENIRSKRENDELRVQCEGLLRENKELRDEIDKTHEINERLQTMIEKGVRNQRQEEEIDYPNIESKGPSKDEASLSSATRRYGGNKNTFDSHSTVTFDQSERDENYFEQQRFQQNETGKKALDRDRYIRELEEKLTESRNEVKGLNYRMNEMRTRSDIGSRSQRPEQTNQAGSFITDFSGSTSQIHNFEELSLGDMSLGKDSNAMRIIENIKQKALSNKQSFQKRIREFESILRHVEKCVGRTLDAFESKDEEQVSQEQATSLNESSNNGEEDLMSELLSRNPNLHDWLMKITRSFEILDKRYAKNYSKFSDIIFLKRLGTLIIKKYPNESENIEKLLNVVSDESSFRTRPGTQKMERRDPSHTINTLKDCILQVIESSKDRKREELKSPMKAVLNQDQLVSVLEYSKNLNDFADFLIEMMNSCEAIVIEKVENIIAANSRTKAGLNSGGQGIKKKYRSIYNQFCQMLLSLFKKWRQDMIKHANVFHETSFNIRENIIAVKSKAKNQESVESKFLSNSIRDIGKNNFMEEFVNNLDILDKKINEVENISWEAEISFMNKNEKTERISEKSDRIIGRDDSSLQILREFFYEIKDVLGVITQYSSKLDERVLKNPNFNQIVDDPKVIFRVLEENLEATDTKFEKIIETVHENYSNLLSGRALKEKSVVNHLVINSLNTVNVERVQEEVVNIRNAIKLLDITHSININKLSGANQEIVKRKVRINNEKIQEILHKFNKSFEKSDLVVHEAYDWKKDPKIDPEALFEKMTSKIEIRQTAPSTKKTALLHQIFDLLRENGGFRLALNNLSYITFKYKFMVDGLSR